MIVNQGNLGRLYTGFKTSFNQGLGQAASQYDRVATTVPSATREEKYGWIGKMPGMREWVGDRVVNNIQAHDYSIKNNDFEQTIAVDRNDIEDDQYGVYGPLFQAMGMEAGSHTDRLVWELLKAGFNTACYDGQYFFDSDHPVLNAAGAVASVSNTGGGSGTPWFLVDDSRPLKPIIYQLRKPADFVALDRPTDDTVFNSRQFIYGTHKRCNAGFGFWQFAYGSKQTLDASAYATARAAMQGLKGDYGRPLGIRPRLLVVPPALEAAGLEILNAERTTAGATNVWRGTAELLVVPWLT